MPLYEYRCQKCGHTFELIQKFSDEPLTMHEACGGALEKLVSSPAFHLKGSGWYATDYAKSSPGKSEKADKSEKAAESKSDSKGESKTESKTETKTESKPAATSDTK